MLSSQLRLGLPSDLFRSGLPTTTMYTPLLPTQATCSVHLILLELITRIIFGERNRSLRFSFYIFSHFLVPSFLLGPYFLLSTLLSNTLSLRSSLNVSDQVSHPYKITSIIWFCICLYIWIANWKTKDSAPNESKRSLNSACSQFLLE